MLSDGKVYQSIRDDDDDDGERTLPFFATAYCELQILIFLPGSLTQTL